MNGINTREALSEYMDNLHTEYAEEVGLKYGMERGDSIKETGAVHRTTEEYRRKLGRMLRRRKKRFEKTPKPSNSKIQRLPISVELLLHSTEKSSTLLLV